MPVPIRNDGSPGPQKRLLVFVHGFSSSAETWDPMIARLSADATVRDEFEIACFEYTTEFLAVPVIDRLPSVAEIADWLASRLWKRFYGAGHQPNFIDITLVGHSMGCQIIQELLTQMLGKGRGAEFQYIRQAIFFATPHLGSMTIEGLRGFVGRLVKNPQEEMLRGLNQQVADLHQKMEHHVLRATQREKHRYPLACTCFWGLEDNIVPAISARGFFPAAFPLPGNHLSLHCPTAQAPEAYEELVSVFVNRGGT
jgi:pimeloyl-ACP methyl ester carboxylesterase